MGIVSLGSIGQRHLRLARKLRPEIKIIAVRSGKGEKVQEEKIADEIIYNMEDIINTDIQAAIIATPATFHADQALRLMNLGIHVLIEKPLSHSLENVLNSENVTLYFGCVINPVKGLYISPHLVNNDNTDYKLTFMFKY